MTAFTDKIRKRLDNEFRTMQFTATDFMDIAESEGMDRQGINRVLWDICKKELIKISQRTPSRQGGEPVKHYRVVKGASFDVRKTVQEHINNKKAKLNKKDASLKKLESVVMGWGR